MLLQAFTWFLCGKWGLLWLPLVPVISFFNFVIFPVFLLIHCLLHTVAYALYKTKKATALNTRKGKRSYLASFGWSALFYYIAMLLVSVALRLGYCGSE